MKKNIYIEWNGCNRRLLELSKLQNYFMQNGYDIVYSPKKANHILIGTCAFKEEEENNSVASIRKMLKYDAKLLVYGCLPDIAPEKYKEFSNIDYLAPKNFENIDTKIKTINIGLSEIPDANLFNGNRRINYLKSLIKMFSKGDVYYKTFNKLTKEAI